MKRVARDALVLVSLGPLMAVAAGGTPADMPASGFTTLLQVFVALGLVLAAIAVAAWLARRYLPGGGVTAGPVRVIGGVMVGTRERVVVLEIEDTWLVVGVTATHVQALHTLPRPAGAASSDRPPPLRADELLSRWLKRRSGDGEPSR